MGFLDPKPVTPAALDSHPRLSATALSATFVQPWKPSTAYAAGEQVVTPSGDTAAAYNAHTSGDAYDPNIWYTDNGHLIACFTANGSNGEKLSFFYSPDGKSVYGGGGNPAYVDPNTGASLRDPSLTKIGSTFIETHTVNNGINQNFAVLTGTSLANLTQTSLIDCSALPDISRIWAPELIIDPATPTRPYIFFSKINAAGTNGSMWWVQATNDALTTWTAPVHMAWAGEPSHYIDGSIIQRNGTWYMFYSTGTDILRATATTLTGTWTTDKTGNWAGWGTGIEGPEVLQYEPSKYRIYIDRYQSGQGYGWSESTDLTTWTSMVGLTVAPGALPPGGLVRHGSFYKIPDKATLNAVLAMVGQPVINPRTVYGPATYDQGTNATVSPAAVAAAEATPTAGSNNDNMITSDGAGKFTFKEAGEYAVFGTFNVTVGSGVSRTFAELANAAGTVTHARTPGAGEDVFELVVPSYRAAAGEQVLVRTFVQFSGGGSATVNGTVHFTRTSR